MKTLIKLTGIFLLAGMLMGAPVRAQEKDSLLTYELTPKGEFDFNKLTMKGPFQVELIKGETSRIWMEYEKGAITKPEKVFKLDYDSEMKKVYLKHAFWNSLPKVVYVQYRNLGALHLKTAIDLTSKDTIKSGRFELKLEGATSIHNLPLKVKELKIDASGASTVNLSGWAETQTLEASGAADIKNKNLMSKDLYVQASGAADADVYVTNKIQGKLSGSSDLRNRVKAKQVKLDRKAAADYGSTSKDTTQFVFGKSKITIITNKDGQTEEKEDDEIIGETIKKELKEYSRHEEDEKQDEDEEFDGHWGGFEMGFNGYLNPDYQMKVPAGYEFLKLKEEKSAMVNINIAELNLITFGPHLGLFTGVGFQFNNYRFANNVELNTDSTVIGGNYQKDVDKDYIKSKLVINYLTAPLILEFTTQGKHEFHIGAGAQFSWKIGKHSKIVYEEGTDKQKVKDHSNFYLNPYKIQLTGRIGWGWINLFATYSLNTMFKEGKGPEIYPFTAGVTLAGWN